MTLQAKNIRILTFSSVYTEILALQLSLNKQWRKKSLVNRKCKMPGKRRRRVPQSPGRPITLQSAFCKSSVGCFCQLCVHRYCAQAGCLVEWETHLKCIIRPGSYPTDSLTGMGISSIFCVISGYNVNLIARLNCGGQGWLVEICQSQQEWWIGMEWKCKTLRHS